MAQIKLTQNEIKALSGDTRIAILKKLKNRKYLQVELAKELNLKEPTIKQHIDYLSHAGLLKKLEEGRKWKYIELTTIGRNLLSPEGHTITITLSALILAVGGGIAKYLYTPQTFVQQEAMKIAPAPTLMASQLASAAPADIAYSTPWTTYLYYSFIAALLILLAHSWYSRYRQLKQLGKKLSK